MTEDPYRRLQQQLDQYSIGFPPTESGIELDILRALFSDDDAALFLQMTPVLETPQVVASRLSRPVDNVALQLDDMATRGLLFRRNKGGEKRYGAIPFVHGIFEFQVNNLKRELVEQVSLYFEEAFDQNFQANGDLFLRSVPIQESIETTQRIANYDDAVEILKSKDKIVIADCICRKRTSLVDQGCDKPVETCFVFGSMGDYYLDRGMGREISLNEAVAVLEKCNQAGLVTQPATAQNPAGMCNCCGDCCGPLASINKHPRPAELVFSNYVAALDAEVCVSCGICLDRCQMGALTMSDDELCVLNTDRCIGCGLCVTTCQSGALWLQPKGAERQRVPPESSREQNMALAVKRGVI